MKVGEVGTRELDLEEVPLLLAAGDRKLIRVVALIGESGNKGIGQGGSAPPAGIQLDLCCGACIWLLPSRCGVQYGGCHIHGSIAKQRRRSYITLNKPTLSS